jgi:cytochrome c553
MNRSVFLAVLAVPFWAQAAPTGDSAKGQVIATQVCAACHGTDGNSPLPVNPNLAGQHPEYLYKQLRDFKSGERANPIMAGMVAALSDQDMRDVSAYYAARKPSRLFSADKDLAAQGQQLYRGGVSAKGVAACAGCHSPNGAGMPAQYPRIAGQHAQYSSAQLRAFRAAERSNDESMMMRTIASRLSDGEITALSEYLAGLR